MSSVYLGELGRLVSIKCPSSQQEAAQGEPIIERTLEGNVRAQFPWSPERRVWSLGTSDATTPEDQGTLQSFAAGEWGNGPFVFVSADAPVTNLLSPAVASCDPSIMGASAKPSGPMVTPIGRKGRSVQHGDSGDLSFSSSEFTPVVPGQWVTASAFADGNGARVQLRFYSATGSQLSQTSSGATDTPWVAKRLSISMAAPANSAYCRIFGVDGVSFVGPAITWTKEVFPWAAGNGCPKAIIHGLSKNLVLASREVRGARYAGMSFTITEVG